MSLTLYSHPLASYCHKVLIALYENGTPFEARLVDLGDPQSRADFLALWPFGKMPVLRDDKLGRTVPETSIIIEYLERHYPGPKPLLPADPAERLDARLWDRLMDQYVMAPMQAVIADRLRPEAERDARSVSDAIATLTTAYAITERQLEKAQWLAGDAFSIADCAAAPALFYAGIVHPFPDDAPRLAAYFERLVNRPSVARVLDEARPYFASFPMRESIPARFLA